MGYFLGKETSIFRVQSSEFRGQGTADRVQGLKT
jgi:hypothetical protein